MNGLPWVSPGSLGHGQGKITFADGGTHEGCFKDGELHGQGKITFADGGTHEGCFKDGELHRGKHTYAVCLGAAPPSCGRGVTDP